MAEQYMIAVVETDRTPSGECASAEIVPSGDVRARVRKRLDGWGVVGVTSMPVNAQMREEAKTAEWQLSRWHGEPLRLCGYLTRIDIYPVEPGDYGTLPLDRAWKELAARYDRAAQRRRAHRVLDDLGVPAGDPDRQGLAAWLCERHPVLGEGYLREYSALAARPEIAARIPAAYRHWQWVLGAAQSGEHPDVYARKLLTEISNGES